MPRPTPTGRFRLESALSQLRHLSLSNTDAAPDKRTLNTIRTWVKIVVNENVLDALQQKKLETFLVWTDQVEKQPDYTCSSLKSLVQETIEGVKTLLGEEAHE